MGGNQMVTMDFINRASLLELLRDLLGIKGRSLWSASVHGTRHRSPKGEPGAVILSTQKERQMTKLVRFVKDESGATAIEYGLIAAATGLALVLVMPTIKQALIGTFTSI